MLMESPGWRIYLETSLGRLLPVLEREGGRAFGGHPCQNVDSLLGLLSAVLPPLPSPFSPMFAPHHPTPCPFLLVPWKALSGRRLKASVRGGEARGKGERCQVTPRAISLLCPITVPYLWCFLLVPQGNHVPNEFVKKAIQFISVLIGQNPGQWDHYGWK